MWADSIEALWDNIEQQEELGRLGRSRAQRFSWVRAARETLRVYRHAVEVADEGGIAKQTKPVSPPPRASLPYTGYGATVSYPSISEGFTPYFNGDTPIRIGFPSQQHPIRIFTHARNEARPAGTNLAIERTFIATETPTSVASDDREVTPSGKDTQSLPNDSQLPNTLLTPADEDVQLPNLNLTPADKAVHTLYNDTQPPSVEHPPTVETATQDVSKATPERKLAVLRETQQQITKEPLVQSGASTSNNEHKTKNKPVSNMYKSYRHPRIHHTYKFVTSKSHTVAKRRWRNKRRKSPR